MESILGTLRTAGFSAGMTDHGYHAIESHIMGFTLWEVGMDIGSRENLARTASEFLGSPRDELPYLAEHVDCTSSRARRATGRFAFGLDLLLDGLERTLASA